MKYILKQQRLAQIRLMILCELLLFWGKIEYRLFGYLNLVEK